MTAGRPSPLYVFSAPSIELVAGSHVLFNNIDT